MLVLESEPVRSVFTTRLPLCYGSRERHVPTLAIKADFAFPSGDSGSHEGGTWAPVENKLSPTLTVEQASFSPAGTGSGGGSSPGHSGMRGCGSEGRTGRVAGSSAQ